MDQIEAAGVELLEPFVRVYPAADPPFATNGTASSFGSLRYSPLPHTTESCEVGQVPSSGGRIPAAEGWGSAYGHVSKMHFSDSICRWRNSSPFLGSTALRSADRVSLDMSICADEETTGKRKKNEDSVCRSLCAPSPSCVALKNAVLKLYRMEDFTLEPLAEGFFSEVYKVQHKVTGEILVLKLNKISSNRSNVLREVELMRKLRHPNVLRFRGACVDSGQLHALTEHCQTGSLDRLIASNGWSQLAWSLRVSLALDVSRGMEYIHSCGYMHRDLTSRNILCKRVGVRLTAVIGDLGLACRIPTDSSKKLPVAGTPYWMAPECLNEEFYCETADVFSFGIILCEMIAQIEADPDVMPRTATFGLDYIRYSELCPRDAPLDFVKLAFRCCLMDPDCRPKFVRIVPHIVALLKVLLGGDGGLGSASLTRTYRTKMSRRSSEVGLDNVAARLPHFDGLTHSCTAAEAAHEMKNKCAELAGRSAVASVALARHIAAVDPFYQPMPTESGNPFLGHKRFADGQKIYTESYFGKRHTVTPENAEVREAALQGPLGGHDSPSRSTERIRRCCSLPCSAACSLGKSSTDAPVYANSNFCLGTEGLGLCKRGGLSLETRETVPHQFFEEDRLFVNSKVCSRRQRMERASTPLLEVCADQTLSTAGCECPTSDASELASDQDALLTNTACSSEAITEGATVYQGSTESDSLPQQCYFFIDRAELNHSSNMSYVFGPEPAAASERTYLGYAKPIMSTFLCHRRVPDSRSHRCTVWTSSKRCVLL